MSDITKIKVDGEPESSYQLFPKNREFEKRAGGSTGSQSGVQSDWNQNDETQPDYVKNRPFYEETETTPILESQQIDFSQSFRIPTSIVKGNTYLITWDGTDYTITATEKEIIAGEIYAPYLEQADGLFRIEGVTMRAADNGIHTVAISLVDSTTKTIDEKFIPNTIARDNKVVKHIFNIYPDEDGAINEISYDNLSNRPHIYHYNGHGSVSLNTLYNHTDGDYSVAEGMSTIASSEYQHVQGKYNIEDSSNTYAHIVGNGTAITARSNAHTLDWSGNAWYAGTVEGKALILLSSTTGSTKKFKITVNDSGTLSATEVI